MPEATRLDRYDNSWYSPGANSLIRLLWYSTNVLIFNHGFLPVSGLKVLLLRWFGASVGTGVVIKPSVNIKYPWHLTIGNYAWIGEEVWIDNLCPVSIGPHVCISQGALLLTGNHNYKVSTFDLMVGEIHLREGVWVGARAMVCPGVKADSHAVLTAGSVATQNLDAWTVYQGNPATAVKSRTSVSDKGNG